MREKVVGRGREKRRKGCDEEGENRAGKRRNLGQLWRRTRGSRGREEEEEEAERHIGEGPRRRYPSRTAG